MSDLSKEILSSGLDQKDLVDLLRYLTGESADLPDALESLTTNIYQKIMVASGYSVAADTMRQAKISSYLAKLEDELLDEDKIAIMSHEDQVELYKLVSYENNRAMENSRRWLSQNRDTFNQKQTEVERMAQQLSTLSPSKLAQVQKILSGEKLEEPAALKEEDNTEI